MFEDLGGVLPFAEHLDKEKVIETLLESVDLDDFIRDKLVTSLEEWEARGKRTSARM